MKKKTYFIIGILILVAIAAIGYYVVLALSSYGNPNGGRGPDYPYYITKQATTIKNIMVPKGTKLMYDEHSYKSGQQNEPMNEDELFMIELPEGETIVWGGVPISSIIKFFNTEMRGYTVYADFEKLTNEDKTKFSKLWERSNYELGIDVKNIQDWSFNKSNITDIQSCGVNNQRFFKEDRKQQQFLDSLLIELKNININNK